ncbi:hypothetical protein [Algoriphagus chordae]|uniref:Uncharacterized protein n=1 Tax=Algoriphagus chordae TaxID=237019 RepID=A0A2W7S4P3_9BACT|nr:hypothetical protein [Algoriphagus chordae]PZX58015.1 hypothetical protein LV85_00201 [Algoriphagus chordae]
MKFPSIFRTAAPMRFDIKPRYYDPVREEIEQRTSQIKKDLEAQGLLENTDGNSRDIGAYGAGIRGSFAQHKGIKERDGVNMFASTAMIRTFIFLFLFGTIFGYVYLGTMIFEFLAYAGVLLAAIYFFFRIIKPKKKYE